MTHLTGTSTYVRVGGSYSDSNTQPGLFSPNHEEEHSYASHGVGTEYCGRVFFSDHGRNAHYAKSTGIGTYTGSYGHGYLTSGCLSRTSSTEEYAYCFFDVELGQCPNGWGNYHSYQNYQPGCYRGTYYPNATQAGFFSLNTGSSALSSVRQQHYVTSRQCTFRFIRSWCLPQHYCCRAVSCQSWCGNSLLWSRLLL